MKEFVIDNYMQNLLRTINVPENKIKDQKVLAQLLDKVISRDDGELMIRIGKEGGTIEELAAKLKIDQDKLSERLSSMFLDQGIIHPQPDKLRGTMVWKPTYAFMLHDFVFINPKFNVKKHKDILDLLDQYYETVMAPVYASSGRSIFRIIPVNETINTPQSNVIPAEEVARIIDDSSRIGVAHCVCRKRARNCDHPTEVCLSFNLAADVMTQRKIARKISKEEAHEILRISEEAGLVHCVDNKQDGLMFICNCCSCACGGLRIATIHGSKNAIVPSRYSAVLKADECTGCGACIDKCQFNAITMDGDTVVIDKEKCYGCGNCSVNCSSNAILMIEVRPPEHIPEKGESFMGF